MVKTIEPAAVVAGDSGEIKHAGLLSLCLFVAALYFARNVLIPLALGILFAFVLEPLARAFERIHLGRVVSALAAVLIALSALGALSYSLAGQSGELADLIPKFEQNIHTALSKLRLDDGSAFGRMEKAVHDFQSDLVVSRAAQTNNASTNHAAAVPIDKPVPVEVRNPGVSTTDIFRTMIGPSLNFAVTALLVTIFCIFILIGRDDLRARLIRITGASNKRLTNDLLRETGARLSRYLLMQILVNFSYGVLVGLGAWMIGIPSFFLCGMMASICRYIPYIGPWIAALLPCTVAIAMDSTWAKPLLILGLFCVLEILTSNWVEPWLYGNSTGITPLAVLLAAVFWAWLWGPIGLLLSVPLTVCFVSMAKYVPQLEWLGLLFGEAKR